MSKTFTCCELIERIKAFQVRFNWRRSEEDKYAFIECVHKANYEDFCEVCEAWFREQQELQTKLIDAKIEKEKAEGKYYGPRNPKTYKGTVIENAVKNLKEEANNKEQEKPLSFGKSPQE